MEDRVLFYSGNSRAFRAVMAGYVFEISQKYPSYLLCEKMGEEIIKHFPNLIGFSEVDQLRKENIFAKNKRLKKIALEAVLTIKPKVVCVTSDVHSLFELYLCRFGKRNGARIVAFQTANTAESKAVSLWVDLTNAYLRFPRAIPLFLRILFVKLRKLGGHFLVYWVLPLMVFEKPFFGRSSHVLRNGNSGMRDADFQVVFSEFDSEIYRKDGVKEEKIVILSSPLSRGIEVFPNFTSQKEKTALFLWPESLIGFRRKNHGFIDEKEVLDAKIRALRAAREVLNDWQLLVKPHPETISQFFPKEQLERELNCEILDLRNSADDYLKEAEIVVGLPISSTTALVQGLWHDFSKPHIALDFNQEVLGDYYKGFPGIDYLETEKEFRDLLGRIKEGNYLKSNPLKGKEDVKNALELINKCLNK